MNYSFIQLKHLIVYYRIFNSLRSDFKSEVNK